MPGGYELKKIEQAIKIKSIKTDMLKQEEILTKKREKNKLTISKCD